MRADRVQDVPSEFASVQKYHCRHLSLDLTPVLTRGQMSEHANDLYEWDAQRERKRCVSSVLPCVGGDVDL